MAVCCIGGVCVPYTALIPLLLYGIKWIVEKLMEYGLLPKALHEKINQILTTTAGTQKQKLTEENSSVANASSSSSTCCTSRSSNSSLRRRGKEKKEIVVANSSSLSCDDEDLRQQQENNCCVKEFVITIESSNQWDELFHDNAPNCNNNIVICKFTADWCKPCKEINPLFHELAEQYTNNNDMNIQFCIIDVDNDALEEVVSCNGVAILPTFCVFDSKNKKPINKYTGSDRNKLKEFVTITIDNVTKIQN